MLSALERQVRELIKGEDNHLRIHERLAQENFDVTSNMIYIYQLALKSNYPSYSEYRTARLKGLGIDSQAERLEFLRKEKYPGNTFKFTDLMKLIKDMGFESDVEYRGYLEAHGARLEEAEFRKYAAMPAFFEICEILEGRPLRQEAATNSFILRLGDHNKNSDFKAALQEKYRAKKSKMPARDKINFFPCLDRGLKIWGLIDNKIVYEHTIIELTGRGKEVLQRITITDQNQNHIYPYEESLVIAGVS